MPGADNGHLNPIRDGLDGKFARVDDGLRFRMTSAVRPAFACFNASIICASLRFRIEIAPPLSPSKIIFRFERI